MTVGENLKRKDLSGHLELFVDGWHRRKVRRCVFLFYFILFILFSIFDEVERRLYRFYKFILLVYFVCLFCCIYLFHVFCCLFIICLLFIYSPFLFVSIQVLSNRKNRIEVEISLVHYSSCLVIFLIIYDISKYVWLSNVLNIVIKNCLSFFHSYSTFCGLKSCAYIFISLILIRSHSLFLPFLHIFFLSL